MIPAHPGRPPAPHDLWAAWPLDPLVVGGLGLAVALYVVGRLRSPRRAMGDRRDWCFAGAVLVLTVALLTPLDAVSRALASAHMVQHLLLMLVAAPLLAMSAPGATMLRGTPRPVRRTVGRARGRLRLTRRNLAVLRHPVAVWLLYVGTLWFWHAAVPYGAALEHEAVHALEHATFLLTGVLFWALVLDIHRTGRPSPGFGVLLLFATSMQGVFLSALLTFAREPWYDGYATTTAPWGLDPLADQQLAGALMWVPGGLLYLLSALALLAVWIRRSELDGVGDHRVP